MPKANRDGRKTCNSGALIAALVPVLLGSGCALVHPPPVPTVPRMGMRGAPRDAVCATYIAQAHSALAAAGAAAGDPAATAAAHAASAGAMHAYHVCLAQQ